MRSGGAIGQDEGVAGDGRGIKPAHLLAACRVQSRLDPGCNSQGTHHPGQSVRASNKEHKMGTNTLREALEQALDEGHTVTVLLGLQVSITGQPIDVTHDLVVLRKVSSDQDFYVPLDKILWMREGGK